MLEIARADYGPAAPDVPARLDGRGRIPATDLISSSARSRSTTSRTSRISPEGSQAGWRRRAAGLLERAPGLPEPRQREGWVKDADGKAQYWALDRYGDEGLREENWLKEGVQKYHRMVSTILNDLIAAGLTVERVLEPMPDEEMLQRRPDWAQESKRPFALLVRARKA